VRPVDLPVLEGRGHLGGRLSPTSD
jgi:hypothetical protein